ncbi:hypothetical protein [Exiguobacterium sp. TNDT2]|uniref:hypothetical protein n=1 Tax=Exiguobacterium sp. TNDT2 TaxID=2233531 RepID=UPI000DEF5E5D|nr:hypothetical protein [Exiguobacterium sp. TNDT2]
MLEKKLKLSVRNEKVDLPEWMTFSFALGKYINEFAISQHKPIRIIMSLPNTDYIPLLVAMSLSDQHFNQNKQSRSIKKKILELKPGSRIIYLENGKRTSVSVIEVGPSPVVENEMMLHILVGTVKQGVPERLWLERLILMKDDEKIMKRSKKVSDAKTLGIAENELLKNVYTESQLNKASFYPEDIFYMVGNIHTIKEQTSEQLFFANGIYGGIKDFLYVDSSNSYTNGKIMSSQKRDINFEVVTRSPVIFWGAQSYLKQRQHFKDNPWLTTFSRTDNEYRIDELVNEIERNLTQEKCEYVTDHLRMYLQERDINVPRGIELIAWR